MDNEWQRDDCDEIKALATSFSVIEAALRWCNVPDEMLDEIRREATPKSDTGVGRVIWTHPAVPCLEARSALIARAIEQGEMAQAREDGLPVSDHVAYERRHVTGEMLRNWLIARYPGEKPGFLFPIGSELPIEKNGSAELSPRAETTYQHIIAALLSYIKGEVPEIEPHQSFRSENDLIHAISDHYSGYGGLSVSNLARKLPEAKKVLESN